MVYESKLEFMRSEDGSFIPCKVPPVYQGNTQADRQLGEFLQNGFPCILSDWTVRAVVHPKVARSDVVQ